MWMTRRIGVLMISLAALGAETKPERTDPYGEPLPQGAIARLGRGAFPRLIPAGTFAFSPDGKLMASVAVDDTLRLEKPPARLELLRPFHGPRGPAESFAVSPDNEVVASSGGPHTGIVEKDGNWLLQTVLKRKDPRMADDKTNWLISVAISPDGHWLTTACPDGTLRIWAAEHPDTLGEIRKQKNPTQSVVFSPDGKHVATAASDGTVRLWDVGQAKEIRRLPGLRHAATALAYSKNGKVLAAAWKEGVIRLWNPQEGKEIGQILFESTRSPVYAVAVSPDGEWVTAARRRGIQRWNVDTRKGVENILAFDSPRRIFALAYSSSGEALAVAASDGEIEIRFVNPTPGGAIGSGSGERTKNVYSVAFSPDNNMVATAGEDGLRLWELASGREKRRLIWNPEQRVRAAAFSPEGDYLASGEDQGIVRLWEMSSGREKLRVKGNAGWWHVENKTARWQDGSIRALAFLDKRTLAAGERDGMVRLWNIVQGRESRSFGKSEPAVIHGFAIDPNRKRVASANRTDGSVRLWEIATGRELARFQSNVGEVCAVALAPGSDVLATMEWLENTVRLWDVGTGQERNHFLASGEFMHTVSFSLDGKLLALVGRNDTIRVVELATGQERLHFAGYRGRINAFAFSGDGKWLASAGSDSTALVWDVIGRSPDGHWQTHNLTTSQLQDCWRALATDDAASAHRAIWSLTAAPRQTLPFLQEHLRAEIPKDTKRLPTLLTNLESDQFSVREEAEKELEQIGEAAEQPLRKFLAGNPSLEGRRRAERLVKRIERGPATSPETLRAWRALEVLENLGTPQARRLLQKLAEGAPDARLTREAKGALQRLSSRGDTMP